MKHILHHRLIVIILATAVLAAITAVSLVRADELMKGKSPALQPTLHTAHLNSYPLQPLQ
jgi:hypothetical protein